MTIKSLSDLENDLQQQSEPVASVVPEVVDNYTPTDALNEILGTTPVNVTPVDPVVTPAEPEKRKESQDEINKAHVDNMLANIKIDVGNIKVVKSDNPINVFNDINALFIKPTFEVIALQSGYRISFNALNNNDIIAARKINGTEYEQNLKLFKIIYDHIANTTVGKLKFDQFLKNTSENDFPTMVYGLYCATYPKESDYTVKCPHCSSDNTAKVSKYSLIEKPNDETIKYVQAILQKNLPDEEAIKQSILNIKEKFILNESKTLIEITTPSLFDTLESLSKPSKFKNIEAETFGYLKYISQLAIPNLAALQRGHLEYMEVDQEDQKLSVFLKLSPSDKKQLETTISEKINKYSIQYKLPDLSCGNCSTEIKNIEIDLLEMLFRNIVGV